MQTSLYDHQLFATDQPQTCPSCGLRAEILADFSHTTSQTQIHLCPDQDCGSKFVVSMESVEDNGIPEHGY
ncbi:hypothetical protein [Algoriphagus sp. A40]|uniref:hypothetical protein n=1 Tax=Algoriphagus sp. A40 TaxID=1945863 RepID=UPI0011154BD0|nr:hypothetical protein [Algoriphagus sp. A40]